MVWLTHDFAMFAALVVAFATLLTAHVTLAIGLGRRVPRWRAPIALVAAPLAPWWGWRGQMRIRCIVCIVAAVAYASTLVAVHR